MTSSRSASERSSNGSPSSAANVPIVRGIARWAFAEDHPKDVLDPVQVPDHEPNCGRGNRLGLPATRSDAIPVSLMPVSGSSFRAKSQTDRHRHVRPRAVGLALQPPKVDRGDSERAVVEEGTHRLDRRPRVAP